MIKKLGWSNLSLIGLFIVLFSFGFLKKCNREKNAVYTKGVSLGIIDGVKGSRLLKYFFTVDGTEIKGSVPSSFCSECNNKCCEAGDTVIVRFEKGNPQNNDLVVKLPEGVSFQ